MTTVLLVRHGLTALTGPVLAGWTPGVDLDDNGRAQAEALAERLAPVPLDAIVTSPLDRCRQTAAAIAAVADGRTVRRATAVVRSPCMSMTGWGSATTATGRASG